jgi:hypothetical protein
MLHRLTSFSCTQLPVTSRLAPRRQRLNISLPPTSTRRLTLTQRSCFAPHVGTGIFTCCPSPALFSLGLGPTHPTRTDLPSEPLDVRRMRFSLILRYSCLHSHSHALQQSLPDCLLRTCDAPLPYNPWLRWCALAPLHCPRSPVRPVSCYALFQGWLLLSQPPGCLHKTTSFPTKHTLQDLSRGSGFFPSRR